MWIPTIDIFSSCINSISAAATAAESQAEFMVSKTSSRTKTIYLFMFFRQLNCELQSWLRQENNKNGCRHRQWGGLRWHDDKTSLMTTWSLDLCRRLRGPFGLTEVQCATSNRRCSFYRRNRWNLFQFKFRRNRKLIFYSNLPEKRRRFMQFHERQRKGQKLHRKADERSEAIGRKSSRNFINFLYRSSASDLSAIRSLAIAIAAAANMKRNGIELFIQLQRLISLLLLRF